ncbi:hypothetical protein BJV77DRAFT_251272 [Russula vinacea]|nr:hypothetical protein BJV77DRAFT_251272 [Russula vinacea]
MAAASAQRTMKAAFSKQTIGSPRCARIHFPAPSTGVAMKILAPDPQKIEFTSGAMASARERRRQVVSRGGRRYCTLPAGASQRISGVVRANCGCLTQAGSVVTLGTCVRDFSRFTGYSLGALRIGKAHSASAQTQTWSFLIAAAMCSTHGLEARKSVREKE